MKYPLGCRSKTLLRSYPITRGVPAVQRFSDECLITCVSWRTCNRRDGHSDRCAPAFAPPRQGAARTAGNPECPPEWARRNTSPGPTRDRPAAAASAAPAGHTHWVLLRTTSAKLMLNALLGIAALRSARRRRHEDAHHGTDGGKPPRRPPAGMDTERSSALSSK